jgi:tetratricopeptide (TPR) repeat protein
LKDEVNQLKTEDPKSQDIIVDMVRGEDLSKFAINGHTWLLNIHNGLKKDDEKGEEGLPRVDILEYPAVKKRLDNEKIYPKLRSVSFDFHLHRVGMLKDTVHTTELDTVYMAGVEAMKQLDYKRAVTILRPYDDYNAALAFMSADYNHSALDVLGRLDDKDPKVCYLMAMVLIRLEQFEEAKKYFELCLAYDPYMKHRANLDPEMYKLVSTNSNNL